MKRRKKKYCYWKNGVLVTNVGTSKDSHGIERLNVKWKEYPQALITTWEAIGKAGAKLAIKQLTKKQIMRHIGKNVVWPKGS